MLKSWRRVLSWILALVMCLSLFPTTALAAMTEEEQQALYEEMLDLGLVDENGALIEGSAFTLEDGTVLSTLGALEAWLSTGPDGGTLVTVNATGKTATAEQLRRALSIEHELAGLAAGLNALATPLAEGGDSTPKVGHDLTVKLMVWKFNDSVTFEFYTPSAVPCDVTLEAGLFADFLQTGDGLGVSGGAPAPAVNQYGTVTIPKGETGYSLSLDLAKVRTLMLDPNDTYYETSRRPDLWDGMAVMTFQWRVVSGAPYAAGTEKIGVAVSVNNLEPTDATDGGEAYSEKYGYSTSYTNLFLNPGTSPEGIEGNHLYYLPVGEASMPEEDGSCYLKDSRSYHLALACGAGDENTALDLIAFSVWATPKSVTDIGTAVLYCVKADGGLAELGRQSTAGAILYPDYLAAALTLGTEESTDAVVKELTNNYNSINFGTVTIPVTYSRETATFDTTMNLKIDIDPTILEFRSHLSVIGTMAPYWRLHDETSPTVESITVPDADFYPGQSIPITVTFSEPVEGACELVLNAADGNRYLQQAENSTGCMGNIPNSNATVSRTRTFLYDVQTIDSTEIQVLGVRGKDVYDTFLDHNPAAYGPFAGKGNRFEHETGLDYQEFQCVLGGGHIISALPEHSTENMTAAYDAATGNLNVNIPVDGAFDQVWANWNAAGADVEFTPYIVLNNDTENLYPLTLSEGGLIALSLTASIPLPAIFEGSREYLAELYYQRGDALTVDVGCAATATQAAAVKAPGDAFTIGLEDGWPSGVDRVVYLLDEALPEFAVTDNGKDFTYRTEDQFYWKSSNPDIFDMTYEEASGTWRFVPKAAGTAELQYWCKNGSVSTADHTQAAPPLSITVKDGGRPGLVIPQNANTFYTRQNKALSVPFSSNLDGSSGTEGITAALYAGKVTDFESAESVWHTELSRTDRVAVVPENLLTAISVGDEPAYTLRLTSSATVEGVTTTLSTTGYLVVLAQPAVVTLTGIDAEQYVSGGSLVIGWTVEHLDQLNECGFEFRAERNGVTVASDDTAAPSGSRTLTLETPENGVLRDTYIITARAKNHSDPTWSVDSRTITVYRSGALDILVDGVSTDSVTLENRVEGAATTTAPAVTNPAGETFSGLTSALAIAEMRSELGLLQSVSINYRDYDWSILQDMVQWKTTTGGREISDELSRAVTINYRRGSIYEPLENFSYLYYMPQTLLMLCGLRDGTNTVTATHQSLPGLTDSVEVQVNRLKDQLYLFQFTPAVKTTLTYTDGAGGTHTVTSNDDGSLALYEPNGIASDLYTASVADGVEYRGTFARESLKSGEGNGVRGELYPLNALELRRAATAEITLRRPDGTALADTQVTVRGGVYRNEYRAKNRDDAYCAGAMFARKPSDAAALDGKSGSNFTTDGMGVLRVYMDLTQFTTKNESAAVGVGDDLQFIFELQFADGTYCPELVVVDGSLTPRDAMRSGENIRTLEQADGASSFVAAQTVDYFTGREIDVRRHTGVVGPSSNYPNARLHTLVMLWGEDADTSDTAYRFELRSQSGGVPLPDQTLTTADKASYPFSSIPLVESVAALNSGSFAQYATEKRTPMEVVLSRGGELRTTMPLPFGLVDMNAVEKVEDSPSLLSLMANIAAYGKVGGADTEYGIVNAASDAVLNDALSFVSKMGVETGLTWAILTPTEDPTRYTGYLWTGIDTTKLEDLDYDRHGICVEGSYYGQDESTLLGQVNDTFTVSDFKAMANGSYFDDRSALYGAASSALGIPIMFVLEGWMSTEIRYNFTKGEWEVLTTGGGFKAGGQLEYEHTRSLTAYGIPLTYSVKLRGGVTVDFQTAVRYAEQLGLAWNDETAGAVNDYLTALRINAYLEAFGGVGYDKGLVAKIGAFGSIELNNENRFLTRNYLKNPNERNLKGQYLQLDGELGL